ncbi:12647_t:CDS:2, partial [Acaulospora colombiana]
FVIEGADCVCADAADSEIFVTGMEDSTVGVWKLTRNQGEKTSLTWTHILRGHTDRVTCVAASRAWSLVVSGSDDSHVIYWDLNRASYVRSIQHDTPVSLVAIQDSSGLVASCSKTTLMLHTINGILIASLNLFARDPIYSIAFHEREYSKIGVLATGSVGAITLWTWNKGRFHLENIHSGEVTDTPTEPNLDPAIFSLGRIAQSTARGGYQLRRSSVDEDGDAGALLMALDLKVLKREQIDLLVPVEEEVLQDVVDIAENKRGNSLGVAQRIGRHNALQTRVLRFTRGLIDADPPIEGLDETIIIEPARLHITLGVMCLERSNDANSADQEGAKTVQQALELLTSLRSEVVEMVGATKTSETTGSAVIKAEGLPVNLDTMGTLQRDKNDTAHVLWIGPEQSRGPQRTTLEQVAAHSVPDYIYSIVTLYTHQNISKKSPEIGPAERYGFSERGIFESQAYKALDFATQKSPAPSNRAPTSQRPNFGTWIVDEIQLCTMGSVDPDTGAYASVGGIKIICELDSNLSYPWNTQ